MLKYTNYSIVFQEIPNETTLAINLSNCPNHCPDCHSKFLWEDTGKTLDSEAIDHILDQYAKGITCICFMGGDAEPDLVMDLAKHIKVVYPDLNVAWYSGKDKFPMCSIDLLDYIKIGRYDKNFGPLNKETTNQRMYKRDGSGKLVDITNMFWKK